MKFNTEMEMAICFRDLILSKVIGESVELLEEFKSPVGIPDYMLIERNRNSITYVTSIELKLTNWKRAINQSFKYRNFSNESFVVMDEAHLSPAYKNLEAFIQYNVGLASLSKSKKLEIHFCPRESIPFSDFCIKKIKETLIYKDSKANSSHRCENDFSSSWADSTSAQKSKFASFFAEMDHVAKGKKVLIH